MGINFPKSVSTAVTTKKNPLTRTYVIKNRALEVVTSVKYLGLAITINLKWRMHIDNSCIKTFLKLSFLRKKLKGRPSNIKLEDYRTLIRPVLEYFSIVWDPFHAKNASTVVGSGLG